MEAMIIVSFIWGMVGAGGFIFWWTKDYDITPPIILLMLFVSLIGPLSWIIGMFINNDMSLVIIKKRKSF